MADEMAALDTHVRNYAQKQDGGDGRIHMPRPKPLEAKVEESTDNVFDKIVEEAVHEATEEEVEEVVSEERSKTEEWQLAICLDIIESEQRRKELHDGGQAGSDGVIPTRPCKRRHRKKDE